MRNTLVRWRVNAFPLVLLLSLILFSFGTPGEAIAVQPPEPLVAIHVSELTQALEAIPAVSPTPMGSGTTGFQWWITAWHYFIIPETLKEALRSDGTPFIEVSDADITAGRLLFPDGSPRYPILISLAAEAILNDEIPPLRAYVAAGGFLFAGSSAFSRNPDGTKRGDFALATEMGLHMQHNSLQNWYQNQHFTKAMNHRLAANIPSGTLIWRMPLSSEEIPLGALPDHSIHGAHEAWLVSAASSTMVVANGDSGPLLATSQYGSGNFIYHGGMQPVMGHGGSDAALYAYLIFRNAIEWAFEAANLPIIKLSPWRYAYDAAFMVRHDFENDQTMIRSLESSAAFEHSLGATGDYYFCTGTLRQEMSDRSTVVAGLKRAVTNSGATIGSHNGGLKNPDDLTLAMSDFDYWHWGPDEALDVTPSGSASGKAYAQASLSASFTDIEGWLAGTDNGRAGCGLAGNCPRTWAAPYFNSTREDSLDILQILGAVLAGEQKIGPFPHWTVSHETPGKRYPYISLGTSDWYVNGDVAQEIFDHTAATMQAAVDFYYDIGALINIYGHIVSSDSTLLGQYVQYGTAKPRIWVTNAVGLNDWWRARSSAAVTAGYSVSGVSIISQATITGATDSGTAVEFAFPTGSPIIANSQVYINDTLAAPADYRIIGNTIRVHAGSTPSVVQVRYTGTNPVPAAASLSPSGATAGSAAFTLTVNGTGFVDGSVVQWNASDRTTTYVSSTQVIALISASDISAVGTAQVAVYNPAPGGGTSNALAFSINNAQAATWTQTNWSGGGGQAIWSDATRYSSSSGIDTSVSGIISLSTTTALLFSDSFTRTGGNTLSPWVVSMGTWTITGGVLQGYNSQQYTESFVYVTSSPSWTDYTVQGSIKIPAGSFGGGIGGRLNPATGAHYGAWVYPAGSDGGSNLLKLWKYPSWTGIDDTSVPMQQVSLPDVGTGWHTLQMTFQGSRIRVYYDGSLKIDTTDNNYGSTPAYLSGSVSIDWEGGPQPYKVSVDNVSVTTLPAYRSSGSLLSSAYDGGDGVQWQNAAWDAVAGGNTSVCVQTRTADTSDGLAGASWSGCYGASGAAIMSANSRWIQYQLGLVTSASTTSPTFSEMRITSIPNTTGQPVPVASSLSPSSSIAGGSGFTLTVLGSNFVPASVVQWNGSRRTTTYVSPTQLTAAIATADIATTGTATVTVFTPAPGGGTSSGLTFTINNPIPAITSISPASRTAGGAAFTLTVNGSNFVAGSTVRWNGANRTTTYVSATQLSAAITAADITTAGTATVTVYTPAPGGGTSNSLAFTINNPAPALTSISPASGTAGGAAFTLTVSGSNFVAGSVVRWNGSSRTTTYVSAVQLTAAITAADIASAGTATVTVYNPAPGGGTSNALAFTITSIANNPVPAVTSISPATRTAGGAAFTLTVNGSNFVSGSTVRWNGSSRTTTYVSATRLTAAITAADIASVGTATVTVFTPVPGGGTSNSITFTINNPVPAITSFSPASQTAGGAAFTLTVNGSRFVAGSVVRWNGSSRTTTYVSSTQLTAAITAADIATAGTATVAVYNPAPGGGTSGSLTFTITSTDNNPVPTLTSISPASRMHGRSSFTLTVNGSNFVAGSTVRWNGSNRTTTYVSSTRLTAAIAAADIATAGTAAVTVFNPAPGGGTSGSLTFTIR